ncbi:uncharacterized protein C8A04DRAFT_31522 [Dichotomopilus funicola]|uniref:AIG1-type G domain-containing protein n=1 Tax=Dichotomopilus funicola TaxID=1934379 RepID=A0AAN6ZIY9_9PEZI|nr:hypothetical protein C8A04DRAFT_31522 [Dichotomopilus funicola]
MGMTGSGKTTFVSSLTGHGRDEVEIGHSLTSQTIHATQYTATDRNGRRVRVVDTPGFGDTTRSDAEILNEIANHLTTSYTNGERLLGIIFLQRITDVRLSHSAIRSFHILQRLVGPANYGCVMLATTMWSNTAFMGGGFPSAVKRQKQLQGYWDDLFDRKSRVVRHHNTAESAWEILEMLRAVSHNEGNVKLKIQSEMVDDGLGLGQTWAGRYLQEEGVRDVVLSAKELQPTKDLGRDTRIYAIDRQAVEEIL